jgi:hypothetical protein
MLVSAHGVYLSVLWTADEQWILLSTTLTDVFVTEMESVYWTERNASVNTKDRISCLLKFCATEYYWNVKVKVKVTLVQALRPRTGRTALRGSRGIALPFHDHGTRRGWGVSVTPRTLFTVGKDPVTIVQEAKWAPGPVWTGAENLAPTTTRSPDRPARSYPAHTEKYMS